MLAMKGKTTSFKWSSQFIVSISSRNYTNCLIMIHQLRTVQK